MFKKGLENQTWIGKGFKVLIIEENAKILKDLGADVFAEKPKKKKKNDPSE